MFQKKRNTFHGGVHPYEGKELSKDKPIVKAQPGNLLYYAVSQHIGAPAVPIVQKGDHVKAGQKIAEAGGFVSAPVYASVSGTAALFCNATKVSFVIPENHTFFCPSRLSR